MTVMGAFSMVILLGFAVFLVDIAWMSVIQSEAQVASDVAARGALVSYINDNSTDSFAVREARAQLIGKTIFESHTIGRNSIVIDPTAIDLGLLGEDGTFKSDSGFANSVRINMDQVKPEGFPLLLAPLVFGTNSFNVSASSLVAYRPIDVVLCLDISRSMSQKVGGNGVPEGGVTQHAPPIPLSRWFGVIDSANQFLSRAEVQSPSLRVSLVTFGGGVKEKVVSPWDDTKTRVETDLEFIGAAQKEIGERLDFISQNVLGWKTPTKQGIAESRKVFRDQSAEDVTKVMILLSDGVATSGNPIPEARAAGEDGITIHTIYFSGSIKGLVPMENIALNAGGMALNADNLTELDEAFSQVLALLSVSLIK